MDLRVLPLRWDQPRIGYEAGEGGTTTFTARHAYFFRWTRAPSGGAKDPDGPDEARASRGGPAKND